MKLKINQEEIRIPQTITNHSIDYIKNPKKFKIGFAHNLIVTSNTP